MGIDSELVMHDKISVVLCDELSAKILKKAKKLCVEKSIKLKKEENFHSVLCFCALTSSHVASESK